MCSNPWSDLVVLARTIAIIQEHLVCGNVLSVSVHIQPMLRHNRAHNCVSCCSHCPSDSHGFQIMAQATPRERLPTTTLFLKLHKLPLLEEVTEKLLKIYILRHLLCRPTRQMKQCLQFLSSQVGAPSPAASLLDPLWHGPPSLLSHCWHNLVVIDREQCT